MTPVVCLAALHAAGAFVRVLLTGMRLTVALSSATSGWFAVAGLYAASLGWPGAVLGLMVVAAVVAQRRGLGMPLHDRTPWGVVAVLAVVVLARPWVPTAWDEFVWLGKARLETSLGGLVSATLSPDVQVIPPGYPPLWPAMVGWLSWGRDDVAVHVLAASLLVLWCAASALEAWFDSIDGHAMLWVALATPLVWVHLRLVYVDLPLGLLAVALLGALLRREVSAVPLAVVLVAFKDEGLAHVAGAAVAAFIAGRGVRSWWAGATGLLAFVLWRLMLSAHGVSDVDHAVGAPAWAWAGVYVRLLAAHATELTSWGLFWVLVVSSGWGQATSEGRAARAMAALVLGMQAAALVAGTERVRVFAEHGTLINRLLLQLWPLGVLIIATRFRPRKSPAV